MFKFLSDPQTYISLLTLTTLEVILGIDNLLFLSVVVSKLPIEKQELARKLGISLALFGRIILLFSLSWLLSFQKPILTFLGHLFSGHDLILGLGGLFLTYKASCEILDCTKTEIQRNDEKKLTLNSALLQILILDLVFSLDSIITAIGLVNNIGIMVVSVLISVIIMLFCSRLVSKFLLQNPSLKILGLTFLILIGLLLICEALGGHISRTYLYFALFFSTSVEFINIHHRKILNR